MLARRSWAILSAVAVLVCVAAVIAARLFSGPLVPARPIVIGVHDAPPLYIVREGQPVRGLAVDVLNQAAANLAYPVEWRVLKTTQEQALASGAIDIWPVLSITEERKQRFHMTRPWLQNSYSLLSLRPHRASHRSGEPRRIGFLPSVTTSLFAGKLLSDSRRIPYPTRASVVSAVCQGEVDSGFLEDRTLETFLLNRPAGCENVSFAVERVEGADTLMGIASTASAAVFAERLADEIAQLAARGDLDRMAARWSMFRANDSRSVMALHELERHNRIVSGTLALMALTALALFIQMRKSRSTTGLLRREIFDKHLAQEATRHAFEQMEHQAHHDSLTGLPNRLLFEKMLRDSLSIAGESETQVALLFLDLDRFKQINDSLGHAAGDELLRQAAERLETVKPAHSFLARLGGDEFAMLLLHVTSRQQTEETAAKVVRVLGEPFEIEGAPWHCPASIGISMFPDDAQNAASLQRNADTAMYQAKRKTRGSWVSFARFMGEQADRSLQVEQALRLALQVGSLRVHYQAQFAGMGEKLTGFEALLRLSDPKLGTILPSEFIRVAEDTGLIVCIGEWVLRESCRQLASWKKRGLPDVCMAVNVSPAQLLHSDFPALLRQVLAETRISPEFLEIELTETGILAGLGEAVQAIRECGVKISVDDFGTGYSSLSCLHKVPADCVKIDRSFIRDAASVPGSLPFIRTIVALARSLGMQTVAEGVESRAQLEAVAGAGCDRFQGYLLAHPLPADQAEALLTACIEEQETCAA